MTPIYNQLSFDTSSRVTKAYSTSFSMAVNMLAPSIRPAIHSIYGFVRFADEIVDSFQAADQNQLIEQFEKDYYKAYETGISLNPILHSFQMTVKEFGIEDALIKAFMDSMKMDLIKKEYETTEEYERYIYGSADVVGLMCLHVFVNGDKTKFMALKDTAMKLGSAFQKVNFLRDLKDDVEILNRSYFPHINFKALTQANKEEIISEIERDFSEAFKGIVHLPNTSRYGVYTAYMYYRKLLKQLKRTPSHKIMETRVSVKNHIKLGLLLRSYFDIKLNLI